MSSFVTVVGVPVTSMAQHLSAGLAVNRVDGKDAETRVRLDLIRPPRQSAYPSVVLESAPPKGEGGAHAGSGFRPVCALCYYRSAGVTVLMAHEPGSRGDR